MLMFTPSHTKRGVFAEYKRSGKGFSGRVTPLFPKMMIQASKDMGEDSAAPSDSHFHTYYFSTISSKPKRRSQGENRGKTVDAIQTGRKIRELDADAEVTLVDETQGMNNDNLMFDTCVLEE
ncbi:hypothetical protein Tco_0970988 [Tanacetum coccineum]